MAMITTTMPIITNIAAQSSNYSCFSPAGHGELACSRFAALLQGFFGALNDGFHGVVVMRRGCPDGNRDAQHVSPPGDAGVLHHLLQALSHFQHIASTAFRKNRQEHVLLPAPDQIGGASSFPGSGRSRAA